MTQIPLTFPKLPIYHWTSEITKIPLECPKLHKRHQKPKTEKSGTSILLEAITSEVYRIRNSWNLEVFYAKPWCKVKTNDINGLFGSLEEEESRGEWLSSILFGCFLKLVRRK